MLVTIVKRLCGSCMFAKARYALWKSVTVRKRLSGNEVESGSQVGDWDGESRVTALWTFGFLDFGF